LKNNRDGMGQTLRGDVKEAKMIKIPIIKDNRINFVANEKRMSKKR
jgi:hypothetical protein